MNSLKSTNLAWIIVMTAIYTISCTSKPTETSEQSVSADSVSNQPAAVSARPVHWGYDGEDGPEQWASLSPVYALCAEGKSQSPVNISKTNNQGDANWTFDYHATSLKISHTEHMEDIIDNGHTIQVTVEEGSTFTYNDQMYELKQFHFHTPSEHTIDGQHMPMEMHMVHQSTDGSLAVVSVLFEEGDQANKNLQEIIENLPGAKGETIHATEAAHELEVTIPEDNDAYHYTGSLTTPPCSENVQWMVLREMATVTADQVEAFSSRIGPNNRPVQSLNERIVEASDLIGK